MRLSTNSGVTMKGMWRLLVLLVGSFMVSLLWADSGADDPLFKEDIQYARIANPQPTGDPGKVEVLEAFWYGCSHCFDLEPTVNDWLKQKPDDVDFVRFPAIPSDRWEWFAKVFYTAEVLGVLDKIHRPLFEAIHDKKMVLTTPDSIGTFVAEHGVSKKEFISALGSFSVLTKVSRARQLTRRYGITSVPMLIVNGKYRTTGRMAGTAKDMFAVVDFLIVKERPTLENVADGNP